MSKEMVAVDKKKRGDRRWSEVRVKRYCFLLVIGTMLFLMYVLWQYVQCLPI